MKNHICLAIIGLFAVHYTFGLKNQESNALRLTITNKAAGPSTGFHYSLMVTYTQGKEKKSETVQHGKQLVIPNINSIKWLQIEANKGIFGSTAQIRPLKLPKQTLRTIYKSTNSKSVELAIMMKQIAGYGLLGAVYALDFEVQ